MSEEQTTQLVNNELTERINNAYIGKTCNLFNGGTDNLVMIECKKNDQKIDVLVTLQDMEEVVAELRKQADEQGKQLSSNNSEHYEL